MMAIMQTLVLMCTVVCLPIAAAKINVDTPIPRDAPYKNSALDIPTRVQDLLKRMTVPEKVAQLLQPWETASPEKVFSQYNATGLGAWYLSMTTLPPHAIALNQSASPVVDAAATVKARNQMQRDFVEKTRLGIPVTFIMETLHSGGPDATIFPMPINYACSWNESALEMAAAVQADEARAVGTDRGFSPVINLFPDARFGRVQEGYSEDPHLTKVMGAAHLKGLQGGAMGGPDTYLNNFTHALVATVKHYASYGMTAGGIDGSPADLSEQKLREMYLAPWEYLAKGRGLRSVMAAQNMVNGRPMHANKRLLTDILRTEWGVAHALVESDGGDCIGALQYGFRIAPTIEDVAVISLESGMDMDLGGTTFATLVDAVNNNKTSEESLDRATYNVLTSKFAAGIFDSPYTDETRVNNLDNAQNRQLARDAAEQSMVLLINTNAFLPLDFIKLKNIALVGPLADSPNDQCGSYFNSGANVITMKQAFETRFNQSGTTLVYERGANADDMNMSMIPNAVTAAKGADVVIAVLGDTAATCGEMVDRSETDLAGGQLQLLEALIATGTPVVLLLINGRPTTFGRNNPALDGLTAFFVGWRPGEEGGPAFLNLLDGAANPSARLTQAWPRSVGGIGGPGAPYLYPFQGNHMGESYSAGDGPSSPLFRFGEGLSYTTYILSDLTITPQQAKASESFNLTLTVSNTGSRSGSIPVQVYFRDPYAMPVRIASIQLVRFTKVFVEAGSSVNISIQLAASDLGFWDDGLNGLGAAGWKVDPGDFELTIGTAGFTDWSNPEGLLGTLTVLP
eukprot:m.257128 g.257128  ORF g.257128 m.257128 type:complete len:798 (-) comp35003_c0_seq1:1727-4120(-)